MVGGKRYDGEEFMEILKCEELSLKTRERNRLLERDGILKEREREREGERMVIAEGRNC